MDAKEIKKDGRFVLYDNGVVYDEVTRLEWIAGPDEDTTFQEANDWVGDCAVAGGGWRLPELKELRSLYEDGKGCCNMTPLLKTTGGWLWSGKRKGSLFAWTFSFKYGREQVDLKDISYLTRAFAVRAPK